MLHAFYSCVGPGRGPGHVHENHEFFFCLNAKEKTDAQSYDSMHYVEGVQQPTYAGNLFLMPAGQIHFCRTDHSGGCPCLVMNCTPEELQTATGGDSEAASIFEALVEYARPGRNLVPLRLEARESVDALLRELIVEVSRKMPGWRCAVKQLFMQFLLVLYRNWSGHEKLNTRLERAESGERMHDVLRFINLQYMNPIGVEDVLRVCCLSRSHFHAIFRAEVGQTFKDYLNTVRVNRAKELLVETDLPISQIALTCGFASQSRFNTVFRNIAGCSPGYERRYSDHTI